MSFDALLAAYVANPRVRRATTRNYYVAHAVGHVDIPEAAELERPPIVRPQVLIAVWAQDAAQESAARRVLATCGVAQTVPVVPSPGPRWFDAEAYHQDFIAEEKDFEDWSDGAGVGTAWGL